MKTTQTSCDQCERIIDPMEPRISIQIAPDHSHGWGGLWGLFDFCNRKCLDEFAEAKGITLK